MAEHFRGRDQPMPRYALQIEYHGGPFAGWQRQAQGLPSVQEAVERALARLEPGPHTIAAAGRTDAGVHATAQVAHVDLAREWEPFKLASALNAHLRPDPVAILACARVVDDFHARFSATGRRYTFRLVARRAPVTHDKGLVWPENIAPYQVDLVGIGDVAEQATKLYEELQAAGVTVLFDDRDERPGAKFADAELIGLPHRVTISERLLNEGVVEYTSRRVSDQSEKLTVTELLAKIA